MAHRETFRIDIVGPESGDTLRSLVHDVSPRPLSDEEWEALPEVRQIRGSEREAGGLLAIDGSACPIEDTRPENFPVVRAVVSDQAGRLWVEAITAAGNLLVALDPTSGESMGEATMPRRDSAVPFFVRDGRLYLVAIDDFGVQSVEVYRIDGLS